MSGTSAIPGSRSGVSVASGVAVTYGMGYQGPRDYVVDRRSPAGYSRRKRGGGGGSASAASAAMDGNLPWVSMGKKRFRSVFGFHVPQPQLLLSETEEGLIDTLGAPLS